DRDWLNTALLELKLRLPHPDVVGRRIRRRSVDSENRELDLLSGLNAPTNDQSIWRIPTFRDRTAALPGRAGQFAIDPNFCVIVERCFENRCRSLKINISKTRRNRNVDPVPIETKPAGRTPRLKSCRLDYFPF